MKPPDADETWVWLLEVRPEPALSCVSRHISTALPSVQNTDSSVVISYLLAQVTSMEAPWVFHCRDLSDTRTIVALYTPDRMGDAFRIGISVGTTIVLKDALPKQFADGRMGFRVENLKLISVRSNHPTTLFVGIDLGAGLVRLADLSWSRAFVCVGHSKVYCRDQTNTQATSGSAATRDGPMQQVRVSG
jgi:hypothetical protein